MNVARFEAVVIGASAGALEALSSILPSLPADFPAPVMVVVHLPPDKDSVFASLIARKCDISVVEAEDKEPLRSGTVYFAPPDYHLLVEQDRTLSLSNDEPVLYSRPSVDVLFESAADVFGRTLLAIILTGANQDGTNGARSVIDCHGTVIIQNPDGAFSSMMPSAAATACPEATIMSLENIALYLKTLGSS